MIKMWTISKVSIHKNFEIEENLTLQWQVSDHRPQRPNNSTVECKSLSAY